MNPDFSNDNQDREDVAVTCKCLPVFLSLLLLAPVHAAESHLYFGGGLDFGGDTLLEVTYVDGSDEKLYAGEGVHLAVGTDIDISAVAMVRATLGYKFSSINAENGDILFRRVPIELIGYRFFDNHGIGTGLTHHISSKLSCDIDILCDFTADVEDATGWVVEYLYRSRREDNNKGFTVGVRTVFGLDYEPRGGGEDANANSIGINIGISL